MQTVATSVVFQQESFDEAWADAGLLPQQHYDEVSQFPDLPFEPNLKFIHQLELVGALRVFTMRAGDELIGYALIVVQYSLHVASQLQAHGHAVYIDPRYRGRGLGIRLIRFIEEDLREEGVDSVVYHASLRAEEFGRVLEHCDYPVIEHTHGKRL